MPRSPFSCAVVTVISPISETSFVFGSKAFTLPAISWKKMRPSGASCIVIGCGRLSARTSKWKR